MSLMKKFNLKKVIRHKLLQYIINIIIISMLRESMSENEKKKKGQFYYLLLIQTLGGYDFSQLNLLSKILGVPLHRLIKHIFSVESFRTFSFFNVCK